MRQVFFMRRKVELIAALVLLIGLIAAAGKLSSYVSGNKVKEEDVQVILDPGHGGRDPGKVGMDGTLEKDLNLEIAKKVEAKLKEQNISVIMTRNEDEGLYSEDTSNKKAEDMKGRVTLINETKPAMVVSIHQNSYTQENVKGAQVFYYKHSDVSKGIAEKMQELMRKVDTGNTREAKADSTYYMLKKTEVPTVIVECGFLTNSEDLAKLKDSVYQEEMAGVICEGIMENLKALSE